jgi:hypothetical protein
VAEYKVCWRIFMNANEPSGSRGGRGDLSTRRTTVSLSRRILLHAVVMYLSVLQGVFIYLHSEFEYLSIKNSGQLLFICKIKTVF